MPQTLFDFAAWNGTLPYQKFDTVYGADTGGPIVYDKYYYATRDVPIGQSPRALFRFNVTSTTRSQGLFTVNYTYTGAGPQFARGSIVQVQGLLEVSANFTGMVLNAGSGFIQYINQGGFDYTTASAGTVTAPINPNWTTGFFFTPSYSSPLSTAQSTIEAKFGDGYSQRQRNGLNSNMHSWELSFTDRSDKEARAILNYVEDEGGVDPVQLLIPLNNLTARATTKFVLKNPKYNPTSFNLNAINVTAEEVFDI